ncbi:MAG: hypothetical protein GY796_10885, partial [Chloroflexi bacterium]|nr:hypothetical protein [Chloroflexota bacterium]
MNSSSPLRQLIKSGLAYGFGLALGNTFSVLIFQLAPTEQFLVGSPAAKLVQGILWAFFIMGIGGFLGGGIGGYTLPAIGRGKGRWGYAWRSGITFGIGYGLLVFPVILITSLLSFYDISSTPFYVFSLTYGLIGIVFGLIMGLSLGVWTIGRRFPPITWMSAVGFGLGGTVLGYTVWAYILEVTNGQVADGSWWLLLVGVFGFGGLGGTALGFAYHRLAAQTNGDIVPVRGLSLSGRRRRWAIIGGILFLIALLIRPTIAAVGDLLTPRDAALSAVLDLPTTGTHWLGSSPIAPLEQPTYPAIATGANGRIALSWIQNNQIYLQQGQWNSTDMQSSWQVAATVGGNNQPSSPELVVDENGRIHLVWLENNVVQYSQCLDGNCTAPVSVKTTDSCEQPLTANNRSPALTTDGSQLLLVWENNGMLPYAVWPMDGTLPETAVDCLPVNNAETPHLANKGMALTYTVNDSIFVTTFDGNWSLPEQIGDGRLPDLFTANDGSLHATWCNLEDGISYWYGGQVESVSTQSCLTRPDLLLDDNRQAHVVWYGAEVEDVNGRLQPRQLIYESIKTGSTWTSPTIVGQSQNNAQPAMAASADGALHLAWDSGQTVNYAAQVQYECDTAQL